MTGPEIFQSLITFVLGGGVLALAKFIYEVKIKKRLDAREDRNEPVAYSKAVTELTDMLQKASANAVKQAMEDLAGARAELAAAKDAMEIREVEHRTIVDKLLRRIQQLLDFIKAHHLAAPPEEPND